MSEHASPSSDSHPSPGPSRPTAPSTFPPDPPAPPDAPASTPAADARAELDPFGVSVESVRLHTRVVLPVIVLVGFLARVLSATRMTVMMNDGPDFLWQAQRFLDADFGAALAHPYHPLYGAVIALFSWLFPASGLETVALWVSIAGGLIAVPAAFFAVRQLLPARPDLATGTALVAAVHSRFIVTSADILSEGLFTGLLALAGWALIRGVRRDGAFRSMLGAGLLIGLAFLTRPEGLYLVAMIVPWLVGIPVGRGKGWLGGTAALALGALLIVAPYSFAVRSTTGAWGLTAKPALSAIGLTEVELATVSVPEDAPLGWPSVNRIRTGGKVDPKDDKRFWIFWDNGQAQDAVPAAEPATEPSLTPLATGGEETTQADPETASEPSTGTEPSAETELPVVADPTAVAGGNEGAGSESNDPPRDSWDHRNALRKTLDMTARTVRWDGFALGLVGAFVLFRRRTAWALSLLALAAGFVGLLYLHVRSNGYLANRHLLIPLVILLPFFGAGAARLLSMGSGPRAFIPRLIGVLCVLSLLNTGINERRSDEHLKLEAMAWVGAQTEPGEYVAVDRRRDAWLARRPGLVLAFPHHDPELFEKLDRFGVRLLVVDQEDLDEHKPHWVADGGPFVEVARFAPESLPAMLLDRFPDLRDEPDLLVLERRP